jgi:hypothetical protein
VGFGDWSRIDQERSIPPCRSNLPPIGLVPCVRIPAVTDLNQELVSLELTSSGTRPATSSTARSTVRTGSMSLLQISTAPGLRPTGVPLCEAVQ